MEEEKVKMIDMKTWSEFRDTGLLWFTNTILHVFGWAITLEELEGGGYLAIPARTKFRGFDGETQSRNYIKISEYLQKNINTLLEEAKED